MQGEPAGSREALGRGDRFDPVDPGGLFPLVILGNPSYGEEFGGPGRHKEALALANCADVATTCGLVEAFLQLEDVPLQAWPGERLPSIHRC